MYEFLSEIQAYLAELPNLLLAVGAFLIGWLISFIISKIIKAGLSRVKWDDKLFDSINIDPKYRADVVISKMIYYLLLIVTLIVALDIMNLNIVATPLLAIVNEITSAVPNLLKAGLILLAGWIAATLVRLLIQRGGAAVRVNVLLHRWKIVESEEQALSALQSVGRIVFYLVLLLFIPGVLSALNITAISQPISDLISSFLLFIPNLFAAALTLLIGWIIAKILREIVTNVLKGVGLENLADKLYLTKVLQNTSLSSIVGTIVYVIVLIPTTIAALEALELTGISRPAVEMLQVILTMLPSIFISIVLVLVGVWAGRWIGSLVSGILERLGFNSIFNYLGLVKLSDMSSVTLSQIVGRITQVIIVVLFTVQALNVVGLAFLVNVFESVIAYLPSLLVAIVILGLGLYLGTLAQQLLSNVVRNEWKLLVPVAKYGIITVSVFMALDQLGVASSIVTSAFIILLSGVTIAFALAFGLGGRQVAAEWLERWSNRSAIAESSKSSDQPKENSSDRNDS